jgi:hypothetical protein
MFFVKFSGLLFFRFLFSERSEFSGIVPGDNSAILTAGLGWRPAAADSVRQSLACRLWRDGCLGAAQPICP